MWGSSQIKNTNALIMKSIKRLSSLPKISRKCQDRTIQERLLDLIAPVLKKKIHKFTLGFLQRRKERKKLGVISLKRQTENGEERSITFQESELRTLDQDSREGSFQSLKLARSKSNIKLRFTKRWEKRDLLPFRLFLKTKL